MFRHRTAHWWFPVQNRCLRFTATFRITVCPNVQCASDEIAVFMGPLSIGLIFVQHPKVQNYFFGLVKAVLPACYVLYSSLVANNGSRTQNLHITHITRNLTKHRLYIN